MYLSFCINYLNKENKYDKNYGNANIKNIRNCIKIDSSKSKLRYFKMGGKKLYRCKECSLYLNVKFTSKLTKAKNKLKMKGKARNVGATALMDAGDFTDPQPLALKSRRFWSAVSFSSYKIENRPTNSETE
jgi:transposase-like protein